jgi:hypothetical protein
LGKNARPDTLFYVRSEGQPTYTCVDTLDTNGTCLQYFWNWQNPDLIDDTTVVPYKTRDGLKLNDTNRVTVTCKDDDSIRSLPYTFYIFPDAPPPVPLRFIEQPDGDSLRLYWNDTTDFKDGSETQFKVLYKFGDSGDPGLVAIDYTAQKKLRTQPFSTDNYNFVKIFSTASTWVRWQVVVKDARGTERVSEIRQYYYSK